MPGPTPKPPERRQRRNGRQQQRQIASVVALPPSAAPARPDPPRRLTKATREQWDAFWSSPLARLVTPATDLPALERLFELYDERRRCIAVIRAPLPRRREDEQDAEYYARTWGRGRMVIGSTGQPVPNPLYGTVKAIDAEIRALEDRFGLTPSARLKLGQSFGQAAASLEDLNRGLDADEDPGADEDDPRLAVVVDADPDRRRKAAPKPG